MKEEIQAALEILRRAQNPFTPGSAEHWALHVMLEAFEKGQTLYQAYQSGQLLLGEANEQGN